MRSAFYYLCGLGDDESCETTDQAGIERVSKRGRKVRKGSIVGGEEEAVESAVGKNGGCGTAKKGGGGSEGGGGLGEGGGGGERVLEMDFDDVERRAEEDSGGAGDVATRGFGVSEEVVEELRFGWG